MSKQHSGRPRKRFGQHFLSDEGVLQHIVDAIGPSAQDRVFEIGPGRGALTALMADLPAQYTAVEIDRDLVPFLRAAYPSIDIVNDDILRVDLAGLLTEGRPWRVFGNLPYNISSPLIAALTAFVEAHPGRIADMHFMLQKEMADRLGAVVGTKAWGRLSVMVQLHFDIEHVCDVAPESFTPPPKVWSSVIRMLPRDQLPDVDVVTLDRVLRVAFSGRRKRLSNALKMFELDWQQLELDPGLRADSVSAEQYLELARVIHGAKEG